MGKNDDRANPGKSSIAWTMFNWGPVLSRALRTALKSASTFEAAPSCVCCLPSIPLSAAGSSSRSRKCAQEISSYSCRMSHTGLQMGRVPLRERPPAMGMRDRGCVFSTSSGTKCASKLSIQLLLHSISCYFMKCS